MRSIGFLAAAVMFAGAVAGCGGSGTSAPAATAAYACPMHSEATSDKPGKCPKCGMDLKKN